MVVQDVAYLSRYDLIIIYVISDAFLTQKPLSESVLVIEK
jgi:hypothetical protein